MTHKKSALSRKVLTTTGAFLLAGTHSLYAHPEELEETTILASKFENIASNTTASVSSITGENLNNQQITRLSDSLNLIPGVQSNALGPTGIVPALITRGLPTRFAQIVVDGVSIADSTNGLGNFLLTASNAQTNNLEFLRGPQSVLYGGEAVGGVLGYETKVGGENEIKLFGEAGRFDSYKTSASASGTIGKLEYGFEIGEQFTNNDPTEDFPLEDFTLQSIVLGLKWHATDKLSLKFTYRSSDSEFESISLPFGLTANAAEVETDLYTLNTEFVFNNIWTTKLTLGRYEEESLFGSLSSFGFFGSGSLFDKNSLNWSNQITISDTFEIISGYDYSDNEFNSASITSFGDSSRNADFQTHGFYLNSYWTPVDSLLIETGVRVEDHSEFGSDTSWNLGAAYDFINTGTRISARLSESFKTPTLLDSEAFSGPFTNQLANPNLETETALGYEIKLSQEIAKEHFISVTYFHQEIEDAIFTERDINNLPLGAPLFSQQQQQLNGDSTVSGLEIEARGSFIEDRLNYRLAWTIQDREEVIDVPDHLVSIDINYDSDTWLVGFAANYVDGANYQNSASSLAPIDDRIVTRLYGHYEVNDHVKLHARVENLFDEDYEISPFNDAGPGAGRGYFAGVTFTW